MNGGEFLAKLLDKNGIKFLVGYTGGAIMPFFDEMAKIKNLKFIMSRNEQGAAFIAQGISRGSYHHKKPQIGTCISTSGPGAMNLVTGIADAYMDSVPVVAITGQVAYGVIGTDAFQENDVVGVMLPITKQAILVNQFNDLKSIVDDGIKISKSGRFGPVNIDLPKSIQQEQVDESKMSNGDYKYSIPTANRSEINKIITSINEAKKPVIFSGHGVISSNSGNLLEKFAVKSNAPVSFTLLGISSMPMDHKLSLGMMGMHGTVEANRGIYNSDLILAFGMRFDDRVTGKISEYAPNAKIIHIDIDKSEIGKNMRTDLGIHAEVNSTLKMLLASPDLKFQKRVEWFDQIKEFKKEVKSEVEAELKNGKGIEGKLLMRRIVSDLSKVTKGQDMIVTDVGVHQMITARYYNYQKNNSFYTSGGAGTMGAGLPMSIGVKLVNPDETIWCVSGDGGIQMNIQELGTIMEYKLDIKIIILNNQFLGMVRQWQTFFFDGRYIGTPMLNPDYSKIAEAYNIAYQKVEKVNDIETALKTAKKHKGSIITEFICDPSEVILPMVPNGSSFKDMIVRKK